MNTVTINFKEETLVFNETLFKFKGWTKNNSGKIPTYVFKVVELDSTIVKIVVPQTTTTLIIKKNS